MTCSNCGRQNPPTALYCLDCGQKLRDPVPVAQPGAPPPAPATSNAPRSSAAISIPETNEQRLPPMQAVESCPRCGVDNPPGMRFCRMCGGSMARDAQPAPAAAPPVAALPASCPRCHAALDPSAAFCGVCGLPAAEMAVFASRPQAPAAASPAPVPAVAVAHVPPIQMPAVAQPAMQVALPSVQVAANVAMPDPVAAPVQRPELRTDNYGAEPDASAARLVTILKDGSEGPTYRLTGATTDVGRTEGNVLLQEDPYLSPRHARVTVRGGRFYLRDLGSVNGIYYKLREPVAIQSGDVVLLGQQVLRLEVLTEGEVSFGPAMHQGVMLFGTPEAPRFARLVQLTTEGVPRDVFHLHRDETVIGRESGDVVFTDDAFLSRRHAAFKIDRAQRRVSLRDLGSSNGTFVQFRGEREILDGDLFRIGHHLFRFDVGGRSGNGGPSSR